jgi:hypothetical protein
MSMVVRMSCSLALSVRALRELAPAQIVQYEVAGGEAGAGSGHDLADRGAVQRLTECEGAHRHVGRLVHERPHHGGHAHHPGAYEELAGLGGGGRDLDDLEEVVRERLAAPPARGGPPAGSRGGCGGRGGREGRVAGLQCHVAIEITAIGAGAEFVRHGLGVALLPRGSAEPDADLVSLPITGADLNWPISLATPGNRTPSAAVPVSSSAWSTSICGGAAAAYGGAEPPARARAFAIVFAVTCSLLPTSLGTGSPRFPAPAKVVLVSGFEEPCASRTAVLRVLLMPLSLPSYFGGIDNSSFPSRK